MATLPIKVPSVGESISEGILSRWLKPDGSAIKQGDPLFELETDKASQEVNAPADGTLKIEADEGDVVEVGQTVGTIDPDGTPTAQPSAPPRIPGRRPLSASPKPSVAKVPATPPTPATTDSAAGSPPQPSAVSPQEEKVDLAQVEGTGPGGRVTKTDVVDYLEKAPAPAARPAPRQPDHRPLPLLAARQGPPDRETRKRMSGIRQKIAQRLVEAQQTAAILTTFNEADMSRIMATRARYKEPFQKKYGVGLGFMSFFVKAAIEALKAFPNVNGRIDGTDVVTSNYYDIGVAVSTERGLMVPVLRDADQLSFAQIESGHQRLRPQSA